MIFYEKNVIGGLVAYFLIIRSFQILSKDIMYGISSKRSWQIIYSMLCKTVDYYVIK